MGLGSPGSSVGGSSWELSLRPADHGRVFAQVDEEAALEQAVKFCQAHLGAAAQRQVSVAPPVPAAWCGREAPGCRTGLSPWLGAPGQAGGRQLSLGP